MSIENKVPAIRFKGFSGEWVSKKLGDKAEFLKGQGYSKNDLSDTGNPIILYGRLYTKYETAISVVDTFVKDNGKSIVSKGNEVIVPASGETAEDIARASAVVKSGVLLGGDLNVIYPNNEIDSIFLAITISNGATQRDLSKRAQGKSVVHVRNADLKEITIHYPNKNEQTKISNYLQQINTLIAQHQQKHDKLLNLKKSLLEKMFPKQGKKEPEIRFKGFGEEWEEKTLGDIGSTYNGLSGKTKDDFGHGQGNFVTYMNVFSNSVTDKSLLEPIEIDKNQNEVKLGDVFFTTSSETPSEVGMSSVWTYETSNVYLNSFCFGFRPKQKLDSYYLAFMLRSTNFRSQITFLAQGISRYNISKNKAMNILLRIPSINEQIQIGKLFKNLDALIDHHNAQLKKLNNIKQACLDKMFV